MKKTLFICLISMCTITQTKSQKSDTANNINTYQIDSEQLFLKAKKQKSTAWILLGSGTALLAGAAIDVARNYLSGPDFWGYALLAGLALDVASIPYFISSSNNKRKAKLVLKNEMVLFDPQISKKHLVAAGLKIKL